MKTKNAKPADTAGKARKIEKTAKTARASAKPEKAKGGFFAAVKGLLSRDDNADAPKATALLEKQHREVEKLFAALESANGNAKPLVHELATKLLGHMVIEEKLFYPAALPVKEGLVLEGYEEHVVTRFALERLLAGSPKDRSFMAKVKTLKDIIESHVKEEEGELFPKFERATPGKDQRELGAKMKQLFDETVAAGWQKTLAAEGPNVATRELRVSARRTSANGSAKANAHAS